MAEARRWQRRWEEIDFVGRRQEKIAAGARWEHVGRRQEKITAAEAGIEQRARLNVAGQ